MRKSLVNWKGLFLGLMMVGTSLMGAVKGAYHNYFSVELDAVLLRRANSHNKHLVAAAGADDALINLIPPECAKEQGKALIESKDLIHDMHFNLGFSAALKIFQSIYSTWEGRYAGGFAWKGQKTRSCPGNLNIDGNVADQTVDYQFADRAKTRYLSKMYTPELNYWHHVTPRYTDHFSFSWMAGLRYFDIDEKVKLYFTKNGQTSRYRLRTDNTSFGLQIGFDFEYNPYHFLTWGLIGKVGGLFNRDKQRTLMLDQGNTVVIRKIDRSGSNFAYLAQAFPFIELRPTKHFFFIIKYEVLYVGNVATADRNLVFHGSGSILDHDGHIIYHGATGGIQFNF